MKKLIIIPAYNEEETIASLLGEIREAVEDRFDVVVVNDCSTDQTLDICRRFDDVTILDLTYNLGIGGAVQTGYRYAWKNGYDAAIQLDGDGQHDPRFLDMLVTMLQQGEYDMVIGSRFLEREGFQSSGTRRLGISFFQWLIQVLAGARITDPTSGFRACNRRVIRMFAEDYPRDYPEPETNARLLRLGMRVKEIPVVMRERQGGQSSIRVLQPLYYMIKVTAAICIDYLRGTTKGDL